MLPDRIAGEPLRLAWHTSAVGGSAGFSRLLLPQLRARGVQVQALPLLPLDQDSFPADVIQLVGDPEECRAAAALIGVDSPPVCVTVLGATRAPIPRVLARRSTDRAARWWVWEDEAAAAASLRVPRDRVRRLPELVDTDRLWPGASNLKRRLRAELVVGLAGSFQSARPYADVIETFLDLGWAADRVLVVAGSGPALATLRRRYGDRASVRFIDVAPGLEQRRDVLRAFDILVLPEAPVVPRLMLEAMALSVPVVAAGDTDGYAAVRLRGRADLAPALTRLCGNPSLRVRAGSASRRRVEATHSSAAHADLLLAEYRRLAESGAPLAEAVP